MEKEKRYFAICRECGSIEWFELFESDEYEGETRVNYLKSDSTIKYENRFIKSKDKKYLDIVCSKCESPATLIPFEWVDKEERINVFNMQDNDRIKFAEKYLILEGFDNDKDEQ